MKNVCIHTSAYQALDLRPLLLHMDIYISASDYSHKSHKRHLIAVHEEPVRIPLRVTQGHTSYKYSFMSLFSDFQMQPGQQLIHPALLLLQTAKEFSHMGNIHRIPSAFCPCLRKLDIQFTTPGSKTF